GVNRTLAELNIRGKTGATILAISRKASDGPKAIIPTGGERLRAGDVVALAGTEEAVAAATELLVEQRRADNRGAAIRDTGEIEVPLSRVL
ncbi:MAG: TrkA C-terminal domain-containing protein, partial [Gemmatimonadaceae bacterium]